MTATLAPATDAAVLAAIAAAPMWTLMFADGGQIATADADEAAELAAYYRAQGREVLVLAPAATIAAEVATPAAAAPAPAATLDGEDFDPAALLGRQRAARLANGDLVALAAQFRGERLTYGATTGRLYRARVAAGLPGLPGLRSMVG